MAQNSLASKFIILDSSVGRGGVEYTVLGVQDKAQRRGIVTLFQGVATQLCAHKIAQSAPEL